MSRSRIVVALAAGTLAGGCALAPLPQRDAIQREALPHVEVPAAWQGVGAAPGAVADNWTATFGDAELDALVREALVYNADLVLAAGRVEQAAAYAKLAGSTLYPAVNLGARGGTKDSGDGLSGFGLFVSWELDLWGRVRAEAEAGRYQYESVLADSDYARQSIAALVARSWLLAVEARLQRAIAADIVKLSERSLGLARDRLRVGPGDEYDVALAQANLDTARDSARQLALAHEQALRALEMLLGRYPAGVAGVTASLPAMPGAVPAGLPSELLERRADVVAAERRVAAAFRRVEEAKAARLPKIALTASATSLSSDIFVLKSSGDLVASIGANLAAPIFNGYALQAQVEIRTAEQKLAVAEYGRVGQRAFSEVEAALSSGFAADERARILERAVASNARALELAQIRYKVGSGDLRAVTQQTIALSVARTSLLRAEAERRMQRVNLHAALGGGFAPSPQPAAGAAPTIAGAKAP
ncbi:MAG: efflux transporter outer membrane subunit [Betaproteobacteria bacterium]|nr:efflux transporter outer membrane subunit [Betaproteobacteria bacterium]